MRKQPSTRIRFGIRARKGPLLLLLLAVTLAGVGLWLAGCSGPSPLDPDPPVVVDGPCGALPETFTPFSGGVTSVATDTTLEIGTWNLEFFPLALPGDFDCPHPVDQDRIFAAADLINLVELDVIAVQEISDPAGFQALLDLCPEYDGILSPEDRGCNYQRVGIIYRRDQVTVNSSRLLFQGNTYAFPRAPLQADLTIASNGKSYDLSLISVHFKASGDFESEQRRREATRLLKNYLDQQAVSDPEANYMVAGDWNDEIDEPITINSFPALIQDPEDYEFLSMSLAGKREFTSHPFGGGSLIDHLLINRAACADFEGARVTTFRFDQLVPGYDDISDHRPVVVQAPVFK